MRNERRNTRWIVFTALAVALEMLAPGRVAAQSIPPLGVFPTMNQGTPVDYAPLREACLNPTDWPTGWSRMSLFGNAAQFWHTWPSTTEIAQCFSNLNAAGKEVAVEAGALKPHCTTGLDCWNAIVGIFTRLDALNPPPYWLVIDEPMTTHTFPPSYAYSYVVDETAEFIMHARNAYPSMKFMLLESYSNAWSVSTLNSFFADVNQAVFIKTGSGIEYAGIDHDWNAKPLNTATRNDLLSLQTAIHNAGMAVANIFWDASTTLSWQPALMQQGYTYQGWRANGLMPDMYLISNWTSAPTTVTPEWNTGTFSRSVRDFSLALLPTPSLAPGDVLFPGDSRTSADGRFVLQYQYDGNLVLYMGGSWQWQTYTNYGIPGMVAMQHDGNLVVYDSSMNWQWQSYTYTSGGAFLQVQSDGNLVIYRGNAVNDAIWASNTGSY